MIYLDNAATSWPKPPSVEAAMVGYMRGVGASPGRSGHRLANEAERIRFDAREAVAELFGVADPNRVVFTLNATEALNLALMGLVEPGSHVVTTGMEHNAVMRPLRALEELGVVVSGVECGPDGSLRADDVERLLRDDTRLIVANHASNVCGTILPIRQIGVIANQRGIPFLVDAAQTGGALPINMKIDNIDLLAFSGHKGLLGPAGVGGLVLSDEFDPELLPPLVRGGTGSRSESETQPTFLPDKYESGTPNTAGIAGLCAGVCYVLDQGVEQVAAHEQRLTRILIEALDQTPGVRIVGTRNAELQTAVVSFNIEDRSVSQVAQTLDESFEIMCRPGLHCALRAHQTLGTTPDGTVRLSLGLFNSERDVLAATEAVARISAGVRV